MSLYNQILGVHPFAKHLFAIMSFNMENVVDGKYPVGRIRDIYIVKRDNDLIIILFTRNGGGNRSDYKYVFEAMKKHPCYIKNYNCDIDSTYAYIEFSPPKGAENVIQEIYDVAPEERGMKMFMKMVDDMKNGKNDPFVNKAKEIGKKIIDKVIETKDSCERGINIIEV